MKTKSLYLAALIVMAAAVTSVGKDEPRNTLAVVPVKGSEVFKVIYKGESASKVKLNVYNSSAEIVFSETMNTIGFIRPLNFKGLDSGEYTIELTDASGKQTERVQYQPAQSVSHVHVSKLGSDGKKFLVSVANNNGEIVTVRIFDAENNLLFTDNKTVAGDFAQLYSLKNVSGAVTFQVSSESGSFKTITF